VPAIGASPTIESVIDRALEAYAALAELGETIDDEWSYIQDLTEAWTERLRAVVAERGSEPATPSLVDAVDALAAETARIEDPHRAIDWLSTFPQVVLVALGEPS
jgi:hypothetical protein